MGGTLNKADSRNFLLTAGEDQLRWDSLQVVSRPDSLLSVRYMWLKEGDTLLQGKMEQNPLPEIYIPEVEIIATDSGTLPISLNVLISWDNQQSSYALKQYRDSSQFMLAVNQAKDDGEPDRLATEDVPLVPVNPKAIPTVDISDLVALPINFGWPLVISILLLLAFIAYEYIQWKRLRWVLDQSANWNLR